MEKDEITKTDEVATQNQPDTDSQAETKVKTPSFFRDRKYPSATDIFALLGVFLVASVIAVTVMSVLTQTNSASPGFALFIGYIIQFLFTIVFAVFHKHSRVPEAKPLLKFSLKKVNPAVILWGLVMVVAASVVIEPLVNFFPDSYFESISRIMGNGGWAMLTILVAAPILEEVLFRGIIQESLTNKFGPLAGILVTSGIFAVIHINPPQVVNAFFVALILGYIYYMTQSLIPVILIHALNNAIAYFSWMMSGGKMMSTSEMISNSTVYYIVYAVSCVILIIAFLGIYRAIKIKPNPL